MGRPRKFAEKTAPLTTHLPIPWVERIKARAAEQGISTSDEIARLLEKFPYVSGAPAAEVQKASAKSGTRTPISNVTPLPDREKIEGSAEWRRKKSGSAAGRAEIAAYETASAAAQARHPSSQPPEDEEVF